MFRTSYVQFLVINCQTLYSTCILTVFEISITEYSDFAAIVQMRLLGLLNEKETRAGSIEQARKWLNGALQNISEIGTFRCVLLDQDQ